MSGFACAHCLALADALRLCVSAMKMQTSREDGSLHIPQQTAILIWNEALKKAEEAFVISEERAT